MLESITKTNNNNNKIKTKCTIYKTCRYFLSGPRSRSINLDLDSISVDKRSELLVCNSLANRPGCPSQSRLDLDRQRDASDLDLFSVCMMHTFIVEILKISLVVTSVAKMGASTDKDPCSSPGWFGASCKYKCRCGNARAAPCDYKTGACVQPLTCHIGWFGQACQYRAALSDLPIWATDNNTMTCNNRRDRSITIQLATPQTLTWLLLGSSSSDHLDRITVQYMTVGNTSNGQRCPVQKRSFMANIRNSYFTREVLCPVKDLVNTVILSGAGVQALCSVHISMGRNVALKQTIFSGDIATLWTLTSAVDGVVSSDPKTQPVNSNACSNNSTFPKKAKFHLVFDYPMELSTMLLYFRVKGDKGDCCKDSARMRATFFDANLQQLFVHLVTDRANLAYSVIPTHSISGPVHMVTIENLDRTGFLSLCEVEAYGDCGNGLYGIQCEYHCNCDDGGSCSPTGQCIAECPPGFYGNLCNKTCSPKTYGPGCKLSCSPFCVENICDTKCGKCLKGCLHQFRPPNCLTEKGKEEKEMDKLQGEETVTHSLTLKTFLLTVACVTIFVFVVIISAFFFSDLSSSPNYDNERTLRRLDFMFRNFDDLKINASPSRSRSWGSNICDAGDDIQSIPTPPSDQMYTDFTINTTDEWNFDRLSFRESTV